MFINRHITLRGLWNFTGKHFLLIAFWTILITVLHALFHDHWVDVPWLPISVIGTAVAFYIGFKNNQAYDRLWEARKIWGGIVNDSRAWGSMVKGFVSNQFTNQNLSTDQLYEVKQRLIYRHIGWLYVLRSQLLLPTPWEHISQRKWMRKDTERKMKRFGVGLVDDGDIENILHKIIPDSDYKELINFKNTATQLIDRQSQELADLRSKNIIEDFRHMEMQGLLTSFYALQGKCERIKKFPLPRQYGGMSIVFVWIFILLLPFGMVTEFHDVGGLGSWLSIPFTILVGWIYIAMELVGDYSENPFEGLGNDIPMMALCRTIEIDLREMLGETDLPPGIQAVNGVLM